MSENRSLNMKMEKGGIDAEVVGLRSLTPLDGELVSKHVKKSGRLLIADGGWKTCGIAAKISARISESSIFNQDSFGLTGSFSFYPAKMLGTAG